MDASKTKMAAPMAGVQIVLTSKIKRWIPTVLNSPHLPEDAEKRLRELYISAETDSSNNSKFIPFSLVKSLYECLQKDQGEVLGVRGRSL